MKPNDGVAYDDDKWRHTKSHPNGGGLTFDDDLWHKEGFTYDDDRWYNDELTYDDDRWYNDDYSSSSSSSDSQDCKSIAEMVCSMSELRILCHAIKRTGLYKLSMICIQTTRYSHHEIRPFTE